VILNEVLLSRENASRLHGTSPLGAKNALHLNSSLQVEGKAVVANPIDFRNFINTIAFLMNRNVAIATEHDEVFVLVIAVVADGTLGVFLHNEAPLVSAKRGESVVKDSIGFLILVACLQLLQNLGVVDIVLFLLPELNVTKKLFFLF